MKNILFAFFTLIITIQGYSQTMNSYFNELDLKFSNLGAEFDMVSNSFDDLETKFFDVGLHFDMTGNEFNALESLSMNMAGHYSSDVSSWWSQIASHFNMIQFQLDQEVRMKLHDAAMRFDMIENSLKSDIRNDILEIASVMNQIGNTFGGFDGSFNSLSGTPTTLAGYGITDNGLKYVTEGGNTGVRLSSANAANHGDIGNTAVDLSYQSSASTTTGATGQSSFAVGLDSTASGTSSISGGYASVASGDTSVALGNGAQATGTFSYSIGHLSEANGNNSVALGYNTTASGAYSTTMGYQSIASGVNSFAIGYGPASEGTTGTPYYRNEALEERSFVIGSRNKSTGIKSFSIGNDNLAQGIGSSSIGENNISTGDYSMALGLFSESIAKQSFAFGNNAYADGYNTTAIGSANTVDDGAIADQWNQNNRAFVIGNGFYDVDNAQLTRSDAFTVWFNGDATLAGNLNINSDARLKANIVSLGSTLAKLLQIDGKSYTMKKDKSEKQKIGLLAQDIEKVFPELVSESNGIKSVNYQGLVPVLINALKEQDVMMKEQQRILSEQQSELDELKSMMKKIIEKQ